ncbi:AbiTii domain-containing protein [Phycicoccus flavus]|uniref:AbiTii domain-containing protein n=1 Tax=Phycicoccus flavus TaxID=2502783 RepID=UPI000FEBF383|nr:hypothetical protein [Phycicoccus flavus]NHA69974.1 hypothetical protein [Phycicoccus flavus]
MDSPLERAVDALTDTERDLPSALRTLVVVARRLKSEPLIGWLDHELNGYPGGADVPTYRQMGLLPVRVTFTGPGGSSYSPMLDQASLPEQLRPGAHDLRQSVADLTSLAESGDSEADQRLGMPLPLYWVTLLREAGERGEGPRVEFMVPESALLLVPRNGLRGALDSVRTSALNLALDLEEVDPQAGTAGHDSAEAQQAGDTFITNVYGTAGAVTQGPGATTLVLHAGDVDGLLARVGEVLDAEGVAALRDGLRGDGGTPGTRTTAVLDRIRTASAHVVAGVSGNAAYNLMVGLLAMVFPGQVSL